MALLRPLAVALCTALVLAPHVYATGGEPDAATQFPECAAALDAEYAACKDPAESDQCPESCASETKAVVASCPSWEVVKELWQHDV